jgi:hypothetical protein
MWWQPVNGQVGELAWREVVGQDAWIELTHLVEQNAGLPLEAAVESRRPKVLRLKDQKSGWKVKENKVGQIHVGASPGA